MKKTITALVSVLLLSACAGTPAPAKSYYWLSSGQASSLGAAEQPSVTSSVIVVDLASYLRQPGIVLVKGGHEMTVANYHLWAEPLSRGIKTSLSYELERLNAADIEWLRLEVRQFHGSQSGQLLLDAVWQLKPTCSQEVKGSFSQTIQQAEPGYNALVASHQELIKTLAKTIVNKLLDNC